MTGPRKGSKRHRGGRQSERRSVEGFEAEVWQILKFGSASATTAADNLTFSHATMGDGYRYVACDPSHNGCLVVY